MHKRKDGEHGFSNKNSIVGICGKHCDIRSLRSYFEEIESGAD